MIEEVQERSINSYVKAPPPFCKINNWISVVKSRWKNKCNIFDSSLKINTELYPSLSPYYTSLQRWYSCNFKENKKHGIEIVVRFNLHISITWWNEGKHEGINFIL